MCLYVYVYDVYVYVYVYVYVLYMYMYVYTEKFTAPVRDMASNCTRFCFFCTRFVFVY